MTPQPLSIMQRARIVRTVKRLIMAEVAHSWKGGADPAAFPEIERELQQARAAFQRALGPKQ